MVLNEVKTRANEYKNGNPIENTWSNRHMNELKSKINATRECVNEVIDLFVRSIEQRPEEFSKIVTNGEFADAVVKFAKDFSRKVLMLLSKPELQQHEAEAIIVDFVNYAALPLDLAFYTSDLQD